MVRGLLLSKKSWLSKNKFFVVLITSHVSGQLLSRPFLNYSVGSINGTLFVHLVSQWNEKSHFQISVGIVLWNLAALRPSHLHRSPIYDVLLTRSSLYLKGLALSLRGWPFPFYILPAALGDPLTESSSIFPLIVWSTRSASLNASLSVLSSIHCERFHRLCSARRYAEIAILADMPRLQCTMHSRGTYLKIWLATCGVLSDLVLQIHSSFVSTLHWENQSN